MAKCETYSRIAVIDQKGNFIMSNKTQDMMREIVCLLIFSLSSVCVFSQKKELDEFNFNLFEKICVDNPNENILFSPLCANLTLGMILNGTDEKTQRKVMESMGLDKYSMTDINIFLKNCLSGAEYISRDYPCIEPQNAIWLQDGYAYKKNYVDTLAKYYLFNTQFCNVDFSSNKDVEAVNKWSQQQTRFLVKNQQENTSSNKKIDIESILYFKDAWLLANKIINGEFHNQNGSVSSVKNIRMNSNNYTSVIYDVDDYCVIKCEFDTKYNPVIDNDLGSFQIPWTRPNLYDLVIYLPKNKDEMKQLSIKAIESEDTLIKNIDNIYSVGCGYVIIPQLSLSSTIEINPYFAELTGINLNTDISLNELSDNIGNGIGNIVQNTNFNIEADGVFLADQSNTRTNRFRAIRKDIDWVIDRPFKFAIVHKESRNVLFMGRINNIEGTDVTSIESSQHTKTEGRIFDIYGRRCSSVSQSGVYIVNGKKVVVR
ncbi:MAG: hypothetical protein IKQ72_00290 [Bacteroidaceae bacterium]|nr:hypothetical protein [Bacteroidaceae bacterium]